VKISSRRILQMIRMKSQEVGNLSNVVLATGHKHLFTPSAVMMMMMILTMKVGKTRSLSG